MTPYGPGPHNPFVSRGEPHGKETMINRIVTEEERSSIGRMLTLSLGRKLRFVWNLRRDPRVTRQMKVPVVLVILYLILPVHVVPRWVPFFRRLDDLFIAAVGLWLFVKLTPSTLIEEHLNRVEKK